MRTFYFSFMIMVFLSSSCNKEKYTDDEFVLQKTDFTGNQLKIDGYYYSDVENENYYRLFVFYFNGVTLLPGSTNEPETYISELANDQSLGEVKYIWGLYLIEGNNIKIEYYVPKMVVGMPAYLETGNIINDTTFVITEVERSKDGSEHKILNDKFHFKHFSPKPDSTNNFVK